MYVCRPFWLSLFVQLVISVGIYFVSSVGLYVCRSFFLQLFHFASCVISFVISLFSYLCLLYYIRYSFMFVRYVFVYLVLYCFSYFVGSLFLVCLMCIVRSFVCQLCLQWCLSFFMYLLCVRNCLFSGVFISLVSQFVLLNVCIPFFMYVCIALFLSSVIYFSRSLLFPLLFYLVRHFVIDFLSSLVLSFSLSIPFFICMFRFLCCVH